MTSCIETITQTKEKRTKFHVVIDIEDDDSTERTRERSVRFLREAHWNWITQLADIIEKG